VRERPDRDEIDTGKRVVADIGKIDPARDFHRRGEVRVNAAIIENQPDRLGDFFGRKVVEHHALYGGSEKIAERGEGIHFDFYIRRWREAPENVSQGGLSQHLEMIVLAPRPL
jgi:hypothetical protein